MKPDPEPLGMEPMSHEVTDRIVTLRGNPVILDRHLAEMYEVETKVLNRAVKRNADRFSERFCFQLSMEEWNHLRYQLGTSNLADLR